MSGAGRRQVAAAKILRGEIAALLGTPKSRRWGRRDTQACDKTHVLGIELSAGLGGGFPA